MCGVVGIVASHFASFVGRAVEALHDVVGILLGNLDVGELAEQVDVPHFLPALHMFVDKLHHLARIEAVGFAQVDEEAPVAALRLPLAFGLALVAPSAVFLGAFGFGAGFLDDRGISVVGQEASEVARHDLLDQVLFLHVFEVAVDLLHEGSDLLLVDIRLLDLVHHPVELFGADLMGCGQFCFDERFPDLLLDGTDFLLLTGVYDRDGGAFLAGTSCTSTAVGVVFDVLGQSEVDDMGEVVDIQTPCSHIRRHEQLSEVLAEFLHGQVALLLRQVAMQ